MTTREWVINDNRCADGPDEPGQNGHYRAVSPRQAPMEDATVSARVALPPELSHKANPDGSLTFAGQDWSFVLTVARTFARTNLSNEVPPPFGFKDRGKYYWWDNTTTDESILDGPQAVDYVREYLELMFTGMSIEVTDNR